MSGNKVIVGFGLSALLGVGLGFAIGIAAFSVSFSAAGVNEQLVGKSEADVVARATFIHANPSDPVHYGKGQSDDLWRSGALGG